MATTLKDIRPYVGIAICEPDEFKELTPKATGGSTTNIRVDALNGTYANDRFNKWWGRFVASTDAGTGFLITDSASTNGDLTITPAVADAPVAADLIQICRGTTFAELDKGINYAITSIENDAYEPQIDETLLLHNMLLNPRFETFSTTFTNWTQDANSTFTQESSLHREGTYCCKMVTDGTNVGSITQSVTNYLKYIGKTMYFRVRVATATADRVRARITDGVNTTNSGYHDGGGWLEGSSETWLDVDSFTVDDSATELTVSVQVSAGSAVTVYIDIAYMTDPFGIYEYSVPSGFEYIEDIVQEASTPDHFHYANRIDPMRGWKIVSDGTTPKIVFSPKYCNLEAGRKIRIIGQSKPSTLTTDAATTEIHVPYIIQAAILFMCHQNADDAKFQAKAVMAERALLKEYPRAKVQAKGKRVNW